MRFLSLIRVAATVSVFATAFFTVCQESAWAQDAKPKMFKIEFKVFPANNPTGSPLTPFDVAVIHYRNKVEDLPDVKFTLEVHKPAAGDMQQLYWVEVQEGLLIDNLVIRVEGAVNPALVTKLVTKNNMVLYPGASDSVDTFKFPAYMTQMGVYRSLFREFVEDAPPGIRDTRRLDLLLAFKAQLENMAKVRDRLPGASEAEIAIATRLKDEVIKLYFGLPDSPPSQECPPPQVWYYPVQPQVCYPTQRWGLFGRLRR